ncbi:hypothetical protein SAMD00019534_083980 [Acytostelium subglobosum LB1]|uniref:hypothetical protein n=1 Tax=Acytostelium subglobosum LB1 TaxID=1410327 RepID=UPI0006447C33|nr:hypothetical protein SAMD00019534_083980 [Acytostelium subglobosum LB1]GAM25223.1 hypothetical protein SAMD00019534_083980 [Acytostelium subglobosum LB1]|eukprot:XP_012751743.1 hypothetical protein SAMD00019534_083980 [Acytostelium subglobosum LB1]
MNKIYKLPITLTLLTTTLLLLLGGGGGLGVALTNANYITQTSYFTHQDCQKQSDKDLEIGTIVPAGVCNSLTGSNTKLYCTPGAQEMEAVYFNYNDSNCTGHSFGNGTIPLNICKNDNLMYTCSASLDIPANSGVMVYYGDSCDDLELYQYEPLDICIPFNAIFNDTSYKWSRFASRNRPMFG